MHILSIDLEEWFQVSSFSAVFDERRDWDKLEKRLPLQMETLFGLLEKYDVQATFFIVGWVAERLPELVRKIAAAGHEIASHGYLHKTLPVLGAAGFRDDLRHSKKVLEDIAGRPVTGFRAPAWSLNEESVWAYDILHEEGFGYDSSVFPINMRYGQAAAPRFRFRLKNGLWEFPLSTLRIGRTNIPVGGGAFFRVEPLLLTRLAVRAYEKAGQPFIMYLHPWELDPDHPRISIGAKKWLIHYAGIASTTRKLDALLQRYPFTSFEHYLKQNMGEAAG